MESLHNKQHTALIETKGQFTLNMCIIFFVVAVKKKKNPLSYNATIYKELKALFSKPLDTMYICRQKPVLPIETNTPPCR